MEVSLQHCIVQIDGGEEVPAIAVHTVVDEIETCHVGFLSKEIVYRDSVEKNYGCCCRCFLSKQDKDHQFTPYAFGLQ